MKVFYSAACAVLRAIDSQSQGLLNAWRRFNFSFILCLHSKL
jgi:hypothetical protein